MVSKPQVIWESETLGFTYHRETTCRAAIVYLQNTTDRSFACAARCSKEEITLRGCLRVVCSPRTAH